MISKTELLSLVLVATLLVIFATMLAKLDIYFVAYGGADIKETIGGYIEIYQRYGVDASIAGRVSVAAFWGLTGLGLYLAWWSIYNLAINYHNHKVLNTTYIHLDATTEEARYSHRVIGAKLLKVFSIIVMLFYIFTAVRGALPLVLGLSGSVTFSLQNFGGLQSGIVAIIISLIAIYLAIVLGRLSFGDYTSI